MPSGEALRQLLFEQGFSTQDAVDRVAGRGVGLSVVAEAARGRGVGALLLREAVALARAEGCAEVELTSGLQRRAAHAFYEKRGFNRTALRFRRALPPAGAAHSTR